MADVFWMQATPVVAASQYVKASLPVRIAGAASDGSQDSFAQIPVTSVIATGQITDDGLWNATSAIVDDGAWG